MASRISFLIFSLLLLLTLGCRQGSRVTGTVTFEDGGVISVGTVMFTNGANSFRGIIHSDGKYAIGVTNDAQKIPFGKYKVWLAETERIETRYDKRGKATDDQIAIPTITAEFASANETPLEVNISSGGSLTYDIVVKAHPNKDKPQKNQPQK